MTNGTKTQIKRIEQFQDRWTTRGANTGIKEISERLLSPDELRKIEIFQTEDYKDEFLQEISPDISIATWNKGAILFEEGSYIDLAFFILKGKVNVYIEKQRQLKEMAAPIFDPFRTSFKPPSVAKKDEDEKIAAEPAQTVFQTQINKQLRPDIEVTFLATMDFDLPFGSEKTLGPGDFFGETGALIGWPQPVTVKTASECVLVQIRVPALRQMKIKSNTIKDRIDKHYRETSLFSQLKNTPLFSGCDDTFLEALKDKVELVSFKPEKVIATEGEPAEALYLVRSGFVKLTQKLEDGEIVVSYLSKGMTMGEIELLIEEQKNWLFTASSVEDVELVKISKEDFDKLIKQYEEVETLLWESAFSKIQESGYSKKNLNYSEFINTALLEGFVEGNSILMIDLNVCTRCDDCVRACAQTHGGIPRFVREGEKYNNFLITRACYHCRDPVCLTGCPTGAIRRARVGDVVEISDKLCIGCSVCATKCPYDAITMYDTGEVWPDDALPESNRGKDRKLATKCDLCYSTGHEPACVSNCPHGCAIRVGKIEDINQLISQAENG